MLIYSQTEILMLSDLVDLFCGFQDGYISSRIICGVVQESAFGNPLLNVGLTHQQSDHLLTKLTSAQWRSNLEATCLNSIGRVSEIRGHISRHTAAWHKYYGQLPVNDPCLAMQHVIITYGYGEPKALVTLGPFGSWPIISCFID